MQPLYLSHVWNAIWTLLHLIVFFRMTNAPRCLFSLRLRRGWQQSFECAEMLKLLFFFFILLYVFLSFFSISLDRHEHHKGMSQHKKKKLKKKKNCWHMILVFLAMTKRCRKWKLQNSGNIRLDLKKREYFQFGGRKKNNQTKERIHWTMAADWD